MTLTVRSQVLGICAVVLLSGGAPASGETGPSSPDRASAHASEARPLRVVTAPTPRFQVPRYDTSGTFPQVRDRVLDLDAVNLALRRAVLADQREFEPLARRYSKNAARRYRGVYETSVDRQLLSASTVVVSALLPAVQLHPGGNEGRGWVSTTVRVPSGAAVQITALFAKPSRGLRALARAWKAKVRGTGIAECFRIVSSSLRPTAHNYRYFALRPRGLVLGFWQPPACDRIQGTIPYAVLRPHLSELGAQLVAGVQRAR